MTSQRDEADWRRLWRRRLTAPPEERWRWSSETWDPVFEKMMAGPIDDVPCPVCGELALRCDFVLVSRQWLEGEERYVYGADRWITCQSCRVQDHDRGLLPGWVDPSSVDWAGPLRPKDDG